VCITPENEGRPRQFLKSLEACISTETFYNSTIMDLEKRRSPFPRISWKWVLMVGIGLLLFGWLLNTPAGLLGKADAVGYAVCHRIDVRSFHVDGRQMPLCARCTGMYLGAMLGLVYLSITARRLTGLPPWKVMVVFGFFVAAFGIDGVNSYLHFFPGFEGLYEPQNWLRLVTGTGLGIAISSLLYPAFNQSAWKDWDDRRVFADFRSLGVLLILAALLDLLVISEFWPVLYVLALISAAGVLVLLTLVYSMVFLMLLRKENSYERIQQMLVPLAAGFLMAMLQIAALDVVRYWLTGTWSGFTFG
jgi:uncharacterized membrane protein